MGGLQPWHLILLLIVVLIVLGPGKLPEVGKALGDAMREFRKATGELREPTSALPPSPAPPTAAANPAPTLPATESPAAQTDRPTERAS